jgi:hypothetical protein
MKGSGKFARSNKRQKNHKFKAGGKSEALPRERAKVSSGGVEKGFSSWWTLKKKKNFKRGGAPEQ